MRIFISYSFRDENRWIADYVIPLVRCFGHEPVTGRILDTGTLEDEVKQKMRSCRRVLCFVTRAQPRYDSAGKVVGHDPPGWVRDELVMTRGTDRDAIEFRESDVIRDGAHAAHAWVEFDRGNIPHLLVQIAERLKEWPVGPLHLRLVVPEKFRSDVQDAANAGTLRARCTVTDDGSSGDPTHEQVLPVRVQDDRLVVPFWVKPSPAQTIEIEVDLGGGTRLVCKGISPAVRDANLTPVRK
jgi:hypothetical protein